MRIFATLLSSLCGEAMGRTHAAREAQRRDKRQRWCHTRMWKKETRLEAGPRLRGGWGLRDRSLAQFSSRHHTPSRDRPLSAGAVPTSPFPPPARSCPGLGFHPRAERQPEEVVLPRRWTGPRASPHSPEDVPRKPLPSPRRSDGTREVIASRPQLQVGRRDTLQRAPPTVCRRWV